MKISQINPSPKAQKYFERIGFEFDPTLCENEFLNRLQYAHVTSVPYENLDILRRVPLKLDPESLYDKIVLRRRGGYCYELNGLFIWLLRDLGFEVNDYMGRYLRGEEGIPMRRHRVAVVRGQDANYICDVGVANQAPRYPLLLNHSEVQTQFGESYRVTQEDFFGTVIYLLHDGVWERFYAFTDELQLDIDYVAPSFYLENSPNSIFNKKEMVAIKTPTGRKVIDGQMFREYGQDLTQTPITSSAMMDGILQQYYGIYL